MAATHNVKVTVKQEIAVVETIPATATAKKRVVKYKNGFTKKLGAATTPAATQYAELYITIAVGVATVDLRALPGADGVIDGNGLKVQGFSMVNFGDSAIVMTSSGSGLYFLFGPNDGNQITFSAGSTISIDTAANSPVIGAANGAFGPQRYLSFTGTNGDTARISIVLG